jgi:hypothetical protein
MLVAGKAADGHLEVEVVDGGALPKRFVSP